MLDENDMGEGNFAIPPELYTRLLSTLLRCGPFASDQELQTFFADARISPWRYRLPSTETPTNRARAAVDFLAMQYTNLRQNALVLFLQALGDQISPGDACHQDLIALSDALANLIHLPESTEIEDDKKTDQPAESAATAIDAEGASRMQQSQEKTDGEVLRKYLPAELYRQVEFAAPDTQASMCLEHLNQLLRAVITYVPRHVVLDLLETPEVARNSGKFLKGTLLFSDISGFTALSERLRRKGDAEGAEAIVKVINDYLDVMLAILFKYNGLLIKFGGDAMLCLFTGEDYGALHAVMAAWEMKQTMLTRFSKIQALDETVELGMKVGGNSGLLLAANVGTAEHMEYILTGGAVEHTACAESWATRGDILISQESYALIKDHLEVERRATGELREHEPGEVVFFKVVGIRAETAIELQDTWQAVERSLAAIHNDLWGFVDRLDALTPYLPAGVLDHLIYDPQHGAIEGQHRQVTVLFINFVGMRDIINAYGIEAPEQITAQLSEYFCAMQEEVRYYGGMINKVDLYDQGDKLMVVFGAPVAHEKDVQRAALTALAMQETLSKLMCGGFLSQRIGINSGYVFAGNVGSALYQRREYTVMGDEVNLAARLMSAAAPGQVLVSRSVWEQIQDSFVAEALDAIYVKGKTDPIQVYSLQRTLVGQDQRISHALRSQMVGRDSNLQALQTCWRALSARHRKQLVVITGEAGVGKTRLIHEWQRWIDQTVAESGATVTWVWCRGRSFAQKTAGIFVGAVEQIVGLTDADSAQRRWSKLATVLTDMVKSAEQGWINTLNNKLAFLGKFLDLDFSLRKDGADLQRRWEQLEPEARQREVRLAVCDLLAYAARKNPVLLILDDLHWADVVSLEMLTFIWDRLSHRIPILCCLLFRELKSAPVWEVWQEIRRAHTLDAEIALKELEHADHRQLLINLLQPYQVSDKLCEMILGATDGNPLYVEEVLHTLLAEKAMIVYADTEWRLAAPTTQIRVPKSLQQIIQSRIDELDFRGPGTRRVLWMAAVIGEQFEEALLLHLFTSTRRQESEEALWQHLEELRNADMLQEFEDTEQRWLYRFRHGLVQQAAYENMLLEKRREYHGLAGEWLEAQHGDDLARYYEVLAYHYSHSLLRDKALFYLDKAARKAQRDYANEAALRYYTQVLAMEGRWEWRKGQVEVLHILGRREEERAALETLQTLASAPDFNMAYLWGQYYEAMSEYAQAQAHIERALAASRERKERLAEARCLDRLGFIAWRQGQYDKATTWYQRALSLLKVQEMAGAEEAQVLTQAVNGLATVYRQQGQFEKAATYYQQALKFNREIGDRLGEARTLNNLGVTASYQQHFDEALAYDQQALEIRRAIGDRVGEGECLTNMAHVAQATGDYGNALAYLADASTIHRITGNRWEEVNALMGQGILHHELGELTRARTCLQQGLELTQEIGDDAGRAYILANLGLVTCDLGELAKAESLLKEGLTLAQAQDDKNLVAYFFSHLGDTSLLARQLQQALLYAEKALTLRRELDLQLWTTADLIILAKVYLATGNEAQALDYAQRALTILDECGGEGPEFPQRDYFACYQVFRASKQEALAYRALESAYKLIAIRAGGINDPALRQSFLEQVPAHRDIVQAAAKAGIVR